MLTSESNAQEFHALCDKNATRIRNRITELVETRYRRAIVLANQKGTAIPPVVGSVKIDEDITLYGCALGVKFRRNDFDVKGFLNYLIMKDLRKQSKIMVSETYDSVIVYNTHAISRYKERLGLNEDMNFTDVCKHMITVGSCGCPKIIKTIGQVYGENHDHTEVRIICLNGAFLGYYSEEKDVYYADTFLSTNEMKESQEFMDVTRDPAWLKWKQQEELALKGKLRSEEVEDMFAPDTSLELEDGSLKLLSQEESKERLEEVSKFLKENPDYASQQIQQNRLQKENRLKEKESNKTSKQSTLEVL